MILYGVRNSERNTESQGAISKMHYAQDTDARDAFSLALTSHSSRVRDKNWVSAKDIPPDTVRESESGVFPASTSLFHCQVQQEAD